MFCDKQMFIYICSVKVSLNVFRPSAKGSNRT